MFIYSFRRRNLLREFSRDPIIYIFIHTHTHTHIYIYTPYLLTL